MEFAIILDLLMLFILFYGLMKRRRLRREGKRATGVVVRHVERRGEKSTYEVPVIVFFDETGKRFEFIPSESVFEPIAREITILYPPGKPSKAVVDNRNYREHDYWFAGILSAIILMMVALWIFGN